jgi:hypothetical protein
MGPRTGCTAARGLLSTKYLKSVMTTHSNDDGAIRAIIPGRILVSLEQKLQQIKNNPFLRLIDVVHLIAGTTATAKSSTSTEAAAAETLIAK